MKKDTNANNIRWFGWKLHILCNSKSELPLDILVTLASNYDGNMVLPLIEQFFEHYNNIFRPTYYAMDSGYDLDYVYKDIINKYNEIPIIAYHPRESFAPPMRPDEHFNPICSARYKLAYWGKDGNYLKFRCPHAVGKCNCPYWTNGCSNSNYGYPLRSSDSWQKLYNKRTYVERFNSRLKKHLNLDNVRSKGIKKVKVHALLNCIALVAGTIAVNLGKSLNKAAYRHINT